MPLRFLYPEADPLTIHAPNNSAYWLLLFVRSDSIHQYKSLYFVAVANEVYRSINNHRIRLLFRQLR